MVISDYRYGTVSDELLAHLQTLRAARFCPLVVDSKDIRRFRTAGATVVTPNHLGARLAAKPGSGDDGSADRHEIERIGRLLLDAIDAQHAAITMGAEGVLVVSRDGASSYVPAHPVAHANDVGAGDSFTASLAL